MFFEQGWCRFGFDPVLAGWVAKTLPAARQTVTIECQAGDDDMLLYDWLNAVIFEMATRHMVFGAYEVEIDGFVLRARAHGETVARERHRPAAEVKGATFTDLKVARDTGGRWVAECVVDV